MLWRVDQPEMFGICCQHGAQRGQHGGGLQGGMERMNLYIKKLTPTPLAAVVASACNIQDQVSTQWVEARTKHRMLLCAPAPVAPRARLPQAGRARETPRPAVPHCPPPAGSADRRLKISTVQLGWRSLHSKAAAKMHCACALPPPEPCQINPPWRPLDVRPAVQPPPNIPPNRNTGQHHRVR